MVSAFIVFSALFSHFPGPFIRCLVGAFGYRAVVPFWNPGLGAVTPSPGRDGLRDGPRCVSWGALGRACVRAVSRAAVLVHD